jgi:hypothetical protein
VAIAIPLKPTEGLNGPPEELRRRDRLYPLGPPGRCFEGIGEILGFVHDLAVAELHNAHCVGRLAVVGDGVFGDPEIAVSEDSLDSKARRLAGMMASQGLQVSSSEDSFAGLGVVADGVVGVDVVFGFGVAGCRCLPVGVQGLKDLFVRYLFFGHGLPPGAVR